MPHIHLTPHPAFTELRAQCLQLPVTSGRRTIQQQISSERLRLGRYRSGRINFRDGCSMRTSASLPLLFTALSAPVPYSLADACLTTSAAGAYVRFVNAKPPISCSGISSTLDP